MAELMCGEVAPGAGVVQACKGRGWFLVEFCSVWEIPARAPDSGRGNFGAAGMVASSSSSPSSEMRLELAQGMGQAASPALGTHLRDLLKTGTQLPPTPRASITPVWGCLPLAGKAGCHQMGTQRGHGKHECLQTPWALLEVGAWVTVPGRVPATPPCLGEMGGPSDTDLQGNCILPVLWALPAPCPCHGKLDSGQLDADLGNGQVVWGWLSPGAPQVLSCRALAGTEGPRQHWVPASTL